jgi:micrococcal nuclease
MVENMMYTYNANVIRVVDGDTVELNIDLGFRMWMRANCRFYGINAPELHATDEAVREKAKEAKAFVEAELKVGDRVSVLSKKLDKYGRPLVRIFYGEEAKCLNDEMIEKSLAVEFMS